MWTCPKCGSKVDPSFEVCWNCGTTAQGVTDPTFVRADDAGAIQDPPVAPELDIEGDANGDFGATHPLGGDLVEAYKALDLMEAQFLAEQLNEAQIPAIPDTHDLHEALGSMTARPRVWVRQADLDRARAWLESYERDKHSSPGV